MNTRKCVMLTLSNNFVTKAISIELTDIIVECTNKQTHVECGFIIFRNIQYTYIIIKDVLMNLWEED